MWYFMDTIGSQSKFLTLKTFLNLYVRSFFIQGSFSEKYRQNIGFAFCMNPVGKQLWDDPDKLRQFTLRHMEDYNGNPFMITLVLGAVAKLEEMLKYQKDITEEDISRFKRAVGPATGSVGDRFFWSTLRPFGIIIGLLAAFLYGLWGVLLFLAVYNIPTLILRWYWLNAGYRLGTELIYEIKNRKIEKAIMILQPLSAIIIVFMGIYSITLPDFTLNWVSGATICFVGLNVLLLKRRTSLIMIFFISLILYLILGLVSGMLI